MKRILFVTSNLVPVPAVKGGAVETLLQIVAEENEIAHKAEIYILCKYDEEAEKAAKKYKNTHIIFYKSFKEMNLIEILESGMIGYAYRNLKNKTQKNGKNVNRYGYTVLKIAEKYCIDEIVIEGGIYDNYSILKEKYSREKIYAHFHRVVHANEVSADVYGHTISVSSFIRDQFTKNLKKRDTFDNCVVLNCANDKKFGAVVPNNSLKTLREKHNIDKDDFVIFFSGRVVPEKGVKELVDAVIGIENPHIKLIVAGSALYADGSETEYVRAIKEKAKNTHGKIMCVGFIPNDRLTEYAQISNVWCVPSTYEEPGALVIMEAMFSGLPIIMSGTGGMKEYATSDCAIIAERDNIVNNLQKAITKLYNDPQLCDRMSEASRKRAQMFTRKVFYDNLMGTLGCL